MTLLKDIKQSRVKQKEKQSIKRDVFNQVSWIVKQHDLDGSFLSVLDSAESLLLNAIAKPARVRMKMRTESPLFSLTTQSEYSLTMSIISKVNNPYLRFANSPDEILLARPLYELNAAISEERLLRFHFETLLAYERFKISNPGLEGKAPPK